MGNARSGTQSTTTRKGHLLEDSSWLKKLVSKVQKDRVSGGGVSSFSDFTIERTNAQDERRCFSSHRVSISFKNGSNKPRAAHWLIKTSEDESVLALEVRIHSHLLQEIYKYLSGRSNVRVRYLLNVPELILSEATPLVVALVLEDLTKTKSCRRIGEKEVLSGLDLPQFKLFLGTLAQFHAVGFAWGTSFGDDSLLESHPYLHRFTSNNGEEGEDNYSTLFERYKVILDFAERKKMFPDMSRRKKLFAALRKNAKDLLGSDVLQDMASPICSLCLGSPVPSDVLFRYEEGGGPPICAAVNTCSRLHFGNVIREVASAFFTLPDPLVRDHYLTFMLQNYCQAFTLTSELLEAQTLKRINYSFGDFLSEFYDFVPHGMLRAIVMHMRRVKPGEAQGLANGKEPSLDSWDEKSYYIPLSNARIRFLVALLNPLKKCA